MKMTKKIMSLAIVFAMVMAMSVSVFAADNNTITVTGAQKDETYNAYKMMDLSVNANKTAFRYTVNADWNTFFTTGEGAAYITVDQHGYVTWNADKKSAADMETFGKLAAAYAATLTATKTITPAEDQDITFTGLVDGYYLITSTNGTFAMIETTPDDENVTVNEKNPDHTVVKDVKEDSTGVFGSANDAQIGDTVEYKLTVTLNKGAKNAVLHDTMTNGLTFKNDVVIKNGDATVETTNYTVKTAELGDTCTFHIEFAQAYLDTITEATALTVTYSATLNENAADLVADTNTIKLTWGKASSAEDAVTTTTHKMEVLKYASEDATKANLADATFKLLKNSTVVKLVKVEGDNYTYRVANGNETNAVETFTTVADNNIVILGLDADADYELQETVAPAGYNLLNANKAVTVAAENNTVVEVANSTGTELPSTGGIGTTIFYALGGLMAVGAGVLLVAKKRMEA